MKIGVVIHGPEVIDSGQAKAILDMLSAEGDVTAILGGTMGKAAVIDAALEDVIDIQQHIKPSASIQLFFRTSDVVYLLNHGKTAENGRVFGNMVISNLQDADEKPLVQVERPGCKDGQIIPWNSGALTFCKKLSGKLGLNISEPPASVTSLQIENDGRRTVRKVSGVCPGEYILVNGIVIGKAASKNIKVVLENGFVTSIEGGIIKEHGIEKLHRYDERAPIDIKSAWVKSGPLRRSKFSVRVKRGGGNNNSSSSSSNGSTNNDSSDDHNHRGGKAVIIDHVAERSFELVDGAQLAVTVGDDTTAIAGDILYRLGVPIIGLIDGDYDGLSHCTHIHPRSFVLHLKPGCDDAIGRCVRAELFAGGDSLSFDTIGSLKKRIIELAGDAIESVVPY